MPTILDLSDEMLLLIFSYLGPGAGGPRRAGAGAGAAAASITLVTDELINLSRSCTRFDSLLQDRSICRRLNVPWNNYTERSSLVQYLTQPVRAEVISELNINDLYWIPSGVIRDIGIKLKNLKDLHVTGTLLSFKHLQHVFMAKHKTTDIQKLSMSWLTNRSQYYPICDSKEFTQKLNHLRSLSIFVSPTLIGGVYKDPTYQICLFLSHCAGNLEKLWIYGYAYAFPQLTDEQSRDPAERVDGFLESLNFPKLIDFTIRLQNHRLSRLITKILSGFAKNGDKFPKKPKQLWIDRPDLGFYSAMASLSQWPQLDLSNLESSSLPFYNHGSGTPDLSNCKHIQLAANTNKLNPLPNLNQQYRSAGSNLRSFLLKSLYDYQMDWNIFVKTHPNLTLVNLCGDIQLFYPDWCIALSQLAKLQRISIFNNALQEIKDHEAIRKFRILAASLDVSGEEESAVRSGTSASSSGGSANARTRVSGLDFLAHGCPEIEEFEMGFSSRFRVPYILPATCPNISDSLSSIRLWKNLKKLTLIEIPFRNGRFLVLIAQSCPLLESIRLSNLGDNYTFNYTADLCKALNSCKQLKDFRLEQPRIGDPTEIFQALQACSKLERVVIFSYQNNAPLRAQPVEDLMEVCPKLTVLYLIIGSTSKRTCESLRKSLEKKYKSTRPPLSILIHNHSYEGVGADEFKIRFDFPPKHYRQMVVLSSQVEPNYDYPDKFI